MREPLDRLSGTNKLDRGNLTFRLLCSIIRANVLLNPTARRRVHVFNSETDMCSGRFIASAGHVLAL